MRTPLAFATALGLLAGACTAGSSGPAGTGGPRPTFSDDAITFVAALRTAGDCDALLADLRRQAEARVGPYGLGTGPVAYAAGAGTAGRGPAADDSAKAAPSAEPAVTPEHSTTNVQEAGVDEPDIVKTDGRRIVTITDGVLSVVDATSPEPARTGSVSLRDDGSAPTDLLLAGDKALVFGSLWQTSPGGGPVPLRESAVAGSSEGVARPDGGTVATITEVDLRDPANPTRRATLRVDGAYLTARLVGSTARVVVRSEPRNLDFVYPQSPAGEARATKANQQVVAESKIEDWLPSYRLVGPDGATTAAGLLPDCAHVEEPTEFAGFGSLSVLTFDLTAPLGQGDAVTVLAGGDTVYASDTHLYVATTTYVEPSTTRDPASAERLARDFATSIHELDITGTAPARYLASGTVPGHLLDQFSMSEHDGRLRAATTKGAPFGPTTSESLITVLERTGDELRQVGQVGEMGKGERIYSVRYAGDAAYVVTFRQTDPLYTVDLSDPAAPKVVGELQLLGYSSYLHPIDDHLVIGVGQDATAQGRVRGTKVALFDVSDLAAPTQLAAWTLPNGQSGAEWDHHALLWWPRTSNLVLPVTDAGNGFSGAIVLRVERRGISEVGRIEHPRAVTAGGCTRQPPNAGAVMPCPPVYPYDPILRSLVIGPELWTLSQTHLQANALDGLARDALVALG